MPYEPTKMSAAEKLQGISFKHIMGTDNMGRDVFSRVMYGSRVTLLIAIGTVTIGATVGTAIGALTGFYGGLFDEVTMRVIDALFAFPSILLALVIVSVFGTGWIQLLMSLGIAFIPSFARIVRGEVLRCRNMDYVASAKLQGVSDARMIFVHILPNIKGVMASSILIAAEIEEIERAMAIGYQMHCGAMKACKPGVTEKSIGGLMEGIAMSQGAKVSFSSIVSMHGEIFHGDPSLKKLEPGRLLLVDAGAETVNNYCSDNTRTMPISGKFTQKQREIYSIVEACHDLVIEKAKPGMKWMDMHLDVCRLMTSKLIDLGLMKGNVDNIYDRKYLKQFRKIFHIFRVISDTFQFAFPIIFRFLL